MYLYTTTLTINDGPISYQVHKEGDRLYYKPVNENGENPVPLFWVKLERRGWKPINIKEESIIEQVTDDIAGHMTEIEKNT